jgi:hypothetical protein
MNSMDTINTEEKTLHENDSVKYNFTGKKGVDK